MTLIDEKDLGLLVLAKKLEEDRKQTLLVLIHKLERLGSLTMEVPHHPRLIAAINQCALRAVVRAGFDSGTSFLIACADYAEHLGRDAWDPSSPIMHLALVGA